MSRNAAYKMAAILQDNFNDAINSVKVVPNEPHTLTSKEAIGVYHDILQASIEDVDHHEIAVAIME